MPGILGTYFGGITKREVREAANAAYEQCHQIMHQVQAQGQRIMEQARQEKRHIIVLAGRPYHIDPEINHGIDALLTRTLCTGTQHCFSGPDIVVDLLSPEVQQPLKA